MATILHRRLVITMATIGDESVLSLFYLKYQVSARSLSSLNSHVSAINHVVEKLNGININDVLMDELLEKVFCCLPCKLAIQCKCVCKLWSSIISSPCFVRCFIGHNHNKENPAEGELVVHSFNNDQFVITQKGLLPPHEAHSFLDFLPCYQGERGKYGRIISSCHGLLLCSNHTFRNGIIDHQESYYVCNPLTKQWVAIPPPPSPSSDDWSERIAFTCDPSYHIDDKGGVILNPQRRFKIVRAFGSSTIFEREFDVDIYSSENGEWTSTTVARKNRYIQQPSFAQKRVIVHNNKLYMQVGGSIVVYDPYTNKVCGDIDNPEGLFTMALEGLYCSQGSLWAIELYVGSTWVLCDWRLRMWRLEEKEETNVHNGQSQVNLHYQWNLERYVNILDSVIKCPSLSKYICTVRVFAIHPHHPDIWYLTTSKDGSILLWNMKTNTIAHVGRCPISHVTWGNAFYLELPIWSIP